MRLAHGCFTLSVLEMSSRSVPSAALLAANEQLLNLRAQYGDYSPGEEKDGHHSQIVAQEVLLHALPDHLGWDSGRLTSVLRASQPCHEAAPKPNSAAAGAIPGNFSLRKPPTPAKRPFPPKNSKSPGPAALNPKDSIKIYPDIALGMLRQEQAAAGRLWLLLRYFDQSGSGVIRIVNIRETFTTAKAPLRFCGWRQLRNLLHQGEGLFWQRDKERIWLRSAGKVAANLDVRQLNGRPVAVPVKHLLGSIGEARAYLYATFHAGRQLCRNDQAGDKPIARDTLTALTGLTAESQRGYERRVGMQVNRNYAVGERIDASNKEERVWRQGKAAFEFVDYEGGQGKPGRGYLAWQLPNSYRVALAHRPKGRQKRINQMLSDLFMKGMTGNAQQVIEKRYFGDAARAVRARKRRQTGQVEDDLYWQQKGNGRFCLWHKLPIKN